MAAVTRALRLLPAALVLLALFVPAAAEARSCRSGDDAVQRLSAKGKGVSCSVAKKVVRAHARKDCGRRCRVKVSRRSWSCVTRGLKVTCRARGRRSVSWRAVAEELPQGGPTEPPPGSAPPGTAPGPSDPNVPQGFARDDAGFTQAITNNRLHRYEEGNTGFGDYAYNFFGGGSFGYCSTYSINGQQAQGHRGGTWSVDRGVANQNQPGHYAGVVRITETDGSVYTIGVEVLGNRAFVESGNASETYAKGEFSRTENGATGC